MTVLVLTRADLDVVADLVIDELHTRGVPVHRLDPGDFPQCLVVEAELSGDGAAWQGALRGQHRDLLLEDITAVYYRRPTPYRLHPSLMEEAAGWAYEEARHGVGGILASLPCRWVNHPHHNEIAGHAPHALAVARRCGLAVPRTLITNDPVRAREFVGSLPGRVAAYKALGPGGPHSVDGQPMAVWTSQVHAPDITDAVRLTAHQFQEWIPKRHEVRLTAVDQQLFAAEIHAGSEASRLDFRRDYPSLSYRVCDVPEPVANGVHELMHVLGLRYVALDFLVAQGTRDWLLVDVNPAGQYGFIPEVRDPITRALADTLQGATTP